MKITPALLVVDIQNAFLVQVVDREKAVGLWMINEAIAMFRERDLPIIRVYHTDPLRGRAPDTEPFEFPASVALRPEDHQVIKNYPNAFRKTRLEALLRDQGCNTVCVTGLSAVGCVLATDHGAEDLGFHAFMVKDAIMSHNPTYTDCVAQISDTVSHTVLQLFLDAAAG